MDSNKDNKPLPTIWRVPDDLWNLIRPVLEIFVLLDATASDTLVGRAFFYRTSAVLQPSKMSGRSHMNPRLNIAIPPPLPLLPDVCSGVAFACQPCL